MAMISPSNPTAAPSARWTVTLGQVEAVGSDSETPLDVELVEHIRVTQVNAVGLPFAGQQLLRQRWPVVRSVRFVADHDHRTHRRVLTERLRRPQARERRADDDDAFECGNRGHVAHGRHDATVSAVT